jgi:hypothetical protein
MLPALHDPDPVDRRSWIELLREHQYSRTIPIICYEMTFDNVPGLFFRTQLPNGAVVVRCCRRPLSETCKRLAALRFNPRARVRLLSSFSWSAYSSSAVGLSATIWEEVGDPKLLEDWDRYHTPREPVPTPTKASALHLKIWGRGHLAQMVSDEDLEDDSQPVVRELGQEVS